MSKKKRIVIQEEGNENADWLKLLKDGELKKQDLQAHEDALKLHRKREEEENK